MSLYILYWREPLWLFIFIVPWFIILVSYFYQQQAWLKIADANLLAWLQLSPNSISQTLSKTLLAIAWFLFCIALAGPRTPQQIPPELLENDNSIVVIVDFSSSMHAIDDQFSRIKKAQILLNQWFKTKSEQYSDNLRVALVIYSGFSHTLLIPTKDKSLVKHFISQLSQFRPPTLGNNLAASLQSALDLLKPYQGKATILLLTDGDLGKKAEHAAAQLTVQIKSLAVSLKLIGMGRDEAVAIPVPISVNKRESLVVDGKVIVTRRQTAWLKHFSELSAANYYPVEAAQKLELRELLDLKNPRIDAQFNQQILWNEWFFIPLLVGILLCLFTLAINLTASKKFFTMLLAIFLTSCNNANNISTKISLAIKAQDYQQVLSLVKSSESYPNKNLRFAEGFACYRLEDYLCAQQAFSYIAKYALYHTEQELENKEQQQLIARAVFNLANTHYKLGDYQQAAILFKDAELLGIKTSLTTINQEFAESLAAAVLRRLKDIAKTKQRANWLSSAQKIPEGFEDKMANGIYLSPPENQAGIFSTLSAKQQNTLLERGVKHIQSSSKKSRLSTGKFWVYSDQQVLPQQSAELLNNLMPFEVGLPYIPEQPVKLKGQRIW
ncbi:MAG: VWA domain-containing protein [Pseudomonadota bacterium]